ncbi:neurofibromin-like isoform X2 [Xenia sp. Carnegie-2017]|uniref:neurofibromin-like isoform X2 n=1 Tax=Xenia sp. Carnegie-2017 TaxID=2897299 RepID=UPI001F039890|nr:neurofibromin-like isoform X2 [Xenia sp. Carnegie-2017]
MGEKMLVNKPDEWVRIVLQRFQVQLPHERTPEHNESKESIEKIQDTLITLSEQRFPLVIQGLSKLIKDPYFISSFSNSKKDKIGESNVVVLSAIEKCLCKFPEQCSRLEDDVLSNLLPSIMQFVLQTYDFPHATEVQKLSAKIVSHISSFHFSAIFNKVSFRLHQLSSVDDTNNDVNYLVLIRYLKLTSSSLIILLEECSNTFTSLKKQAKLFLISSLEKAIWNWIKYNAEEFACVQRTPKKKLSDLCDNFFELLVSFAEKSKRKAAVCPLQIMLLMLSPETLTAIASREKQQDAHLEIKREFLDSLKTALTSAKALTESSAIACVKLCKCSTYVRPEDNSVLCFLVVTFMNELKALLFNINKPFAIVNQTTITVESLMVDCFVSSFRINYRNSQHFDDCLSSTAPVLFNVVYVKGLYTIVRQKPLKWWPTLKVMYSKAESIRNLFERTLEKFRALDNFQSGSRMSVLYKGKEKRGKEEEQSSMKAEKDLMLWLVRLFRIEPSFAFYSTESKSFEIHQSSQKLLFGLVQMTLSSQFGKELSQEASQTLLDLHSPENVLLWNPLDTVYSFWEISSECILFIGNSLVNHGSKDLWLLKYLKKLMACRDQYIGKNKDDPNFSCQSMIASSARVKLEEVFLQYLWNPESEAILTSLSCLKFLCTEINIVSNHSMDNIAQFNLMSSIFSVYEELADLANGISTGRLALQKRIMALLRNVKVQTPGNKEAWDNTFIRWKKLTSALANFPKEEIPGEPGTYLPKSVRRRTTRFSQTGKLSLESVEGYINEWNYMTGFLCSLGAVCFKENPELSRRISRCRSSISKMASLPTVSPELETVKSFVGELLQLSVCSNDHVGTKIRVIIKDLIGQELSSAMYNTLFIEIRKTIEGFFTPAGQAILHELNTCFVDQVIAIMKHILENKNCVSVDCFKMEIIEPIIVTIIRYTRNLPPISRTFIIKSRICQLVVTLMSHRDEVLFFQDIKFRNKLVEYLSDWVAREENNDFTHEILVNSRLLDECAMKAISQLLSCLPLQPENTDVDIMEEKSKLFLKYFRLFLNLLSKCAGRDNNESEVTNAKKRQKSVLAYHDNVHQCTVAAMSNLLSANIDAGLTHAIGLGYHRDLTTRAIFMEVLMKILNQGTEFDTLAETATRDRYEQLANLMATMSENGELLLAVALANVVPSSEQDDLAQVMVTLFDAMNLLYQFLWNVLSQEVRNCEGFHVLFRGNTLATKVTTFCFKIYGTNYIHSLLGPLIKPLLKQENLNLTFELDPNKLEAGETLQENTQNVKDLAQKFLNSFFESLDDFPNPLKLLCYCLKKVVSQRFRQHKAEAVGSAIFLRFINPAINSPQMLGIIEHPPPDNIRRGLMFLSKILQSLANNMLFTKEKHMEPLNDFLKENLTKTQQYFETISLHRPSLREDRDVYSFISDANIFTLHRMLWNSQEKIGLYMAARGEFKIYGRLVFEKLTTLLARLGPPDPQRLQIHKKWSVNSGSSDFEIFMARHADSGDMDLQEIRNLKIFYQDGRSKTGHLVYYFIPRRFRSDVISAERLIYYVCLTFKSSLGQPWELVCDFTQTATSTQITSRQNWLTSLTKCISVLPNDIKHSLRAVYLYNMNSALKEFIKINERYFSHLKHRSQVIVIDNLSKFNEFISWEELKLPSTTTSLEKDLTVFNAFRVHSRISVRIKVGPNGIQVETTEKQKVLGYSFHIKEIFFPSDIEDISSQLDDNLFGLKFKTSGHTLFLSNESDKIVQAVTHLKKRWLMSQPNQTNLSKKILPKDVPGTLLNMALLNLGTRDPNLRLAAYNLLCALTTVFHFKIEERLFEGTGLCIPANNTIFIVGISISLASKEPQLTLEFLQECITGFKKSNHELKHLCLEYMAPWFPNLSRYCKEPSRGDKRSKVNAILEDLIELTIAEKGAMYPSIQAKIWGNMGKVTELVDTVLDSFIKASTTGGLGSVKAEVMADTAVALATANVHVVSSKFINRVLMLIRKTCITPTPRLEEHLMWEDIAILSRYLLMLSFNDSLDVANNLPDLFHIIISLVCMGPLFLRATIHGILINVIQSLSTCTSLELPDETKRVLRLRMSEFSLPKFYLLFGISQVKSAPVRAFQSSYRGTRHVINLRDSDKIYMTSIQTIANSLLEVVEACMKDIPQCTWLETWTKLTLEFVFQHNPPLQARAVVVYGCVCRDIDDAKIRQLLLVFIKALNDFSDLNLIEATIICFTKLLTILNKNSKFHTASFWIAIATLQLAESGLYPAGLALLEQSLLTLESQGIFERQSVDKVLLTFRQDPRMEWHCQQLDHIIGVNFAYNFHFALVTYLLKGLRHGSPSTNTRAIRILNLMLNIAGKHKTIHGREKFAVYKETIPYLAALLIVSDEIRAKLRPHCSHKRSNSIPDSQSSVTPPNSIPVSPVTIIIESPISPGPAEISESETAVFPWPAEVENRLLDPGVVNDFQTQALLLTLLSTLVRHTKDDALEKFLFEVLAEASLVFPKVFPVIYTLISSKLAMVLGHSQDVECLQAIQTIMQSTVSLNFAERQLESNFLQGFGFDGFSQFAGPFYDQGELQYETRAQIFVRFAEGVLETCGGVLDDSLRASCLSLAKPLPEKLDQPPLRSNNCLSSSLTSIPNDLLLRDGIEPASLMKRSLSSRRKSNKDRKEKDRNRRKRSLTQRVAEKELKKALSANRNSEV